MTQTTAASPGKPSDHDPLAHTPVSPKPPGNADVIAIGFGTTVVMWAAGFLGRLPGAPLPSWMLFAVMLACLLVGGFFAGWCTRRGVRGGLWVGLISGLLNLLVLGSLLWAGSVQQTLLRAAAFVPGSLILAAGLATVGAAVGSRLAKPLACDPSWPAVFGVVGIVATLLLLAVGGSVTGYDYGLAVVDWPNTEGFNMFLFPLARMAGGIYYEHSHRLIGSLVGLTTIVLAILIQRIEHRRWLKRLAWAALLVVMIQGLLGGLRVTGRLTLSTSPTDTAPSIALAIVHGVFGQIFFALLVSITVALTRTWQERRGACDAPGLDTDRKLTVVFIATIVLQLILGALVRHFTWALAEFRYGLNATPEQLANRGQWALHTHITIAVVVTLMAVGVGVRLWGLYFNTPALRRTGKALLILISVQLVLGIIAVVAVGNDSPESPPTAWDVLLTTTHQTVGAIILGLAVAAALFVRRLLQRPAEPMSVIVTVDEHRRVEAEERGDLP